MLGVGENLEGGIFLVGVEGGEVVLILQQGQDVNAVQL